MFLTIVKSKEHLQRNEVSIKLERFYWHTCHLLLEMLHIYHDAVDDIKLNVSLNHLLSFFIIECDK